MLEKISHESSRQNQRHEVMNSIMRANYVAGRYAGPGGFLGPTTRPSRPDLDDIAAMLTPIVRLARGPDWRVDIDWTTDCLIARNDSGEWTALALRIEIDDNRCGEILACVPRKPVVPSDGVSDFRDIQAELLALSNATDDVVIQTLENLKFEDLARWCQQEPEEAALLLQSAIWEGKIGRA